MKTSHIPAQAKIILENLDKLKSQHEKEAYVSDYLHTLFTIVERSGYEFDNMGFIGCAMKMHEEGKL